MGEMDEALQEFASTGRAGRRNALPDIRGEHASTSTADLPEQLEKMSCSGKSVATPGSRPSLVRRCDNTGDFESYGMTKFKNELLRMIAMD